MSLARSFLETATSLMPVEIKRAYEEPSPADGQRVLVDRLWPRGISKRAARIDHWLKALAPSNALRKWYHLSGNWELFKKRYFKELSAPEGSLALEPLYPLISTHPLSTLASSPPTLPPTHAIRLN